MSILLTEFDPAPAIIEPASLIAPLDGFPPVAIGPFSGDLFSAPLWPPAPPSVAFPSRPFSIPPITWMPPPGISEGSPARASISATRYWAWPLRLRWRWTALSAKAWGLRHGRFQRGPHLAQPRHDGGGDEPRIHHALQLLQRYPAIIRRLPWLQADLRSTLHRI